MDGQLGNYYALGPDETIVEGVTAAIATATDEGVTDLPPLYEVIDPECLELLFEGGSDDVRVTFQYAGYDVVVDGNGRIAVARASGETTHSLGECAHCGTEFELDVDYPVATRQVDDELTFFAFCDSECRAEWEAEQPPIRDDG